MADAPDQSQRLKLEHAQLLKLKEIGAKINAANRVVILSHVSPDGDTVGTALGLADILRAQGKEVTVLIPSPAMANLRQMPGWDDFVVDDPKQAARAMATSDAVIAVDNTGLNRFGNWRWVIPAAKKRGITTINLDHHDTNDQFADLNYVEPSASAAAVVITRLAQLMRWKISPRAATDLFAGLRSDTGGFHNAAGNAEAFYYGYVLLTAGADKEFVQKMQGPKDLSPAEKNLFDRVYKARVETPEGVVSIGVTQEMLNTAGIQPVDAKFVLWDMERKVKWNVMVAATQLTPTIVAISVRTKDPVSAIDIVKDFGGGGHAQAAGATVKGQPLQKVLDAVAAKAQEVVAKVAQGPDLGVAA